MKFVSPFIKRGWKCLRGILHKHSHEFTQECFSPASPQPTLCNTPAAVLFLSHGLTSLALSCLNAKLEGLDLKLSSITGILFFSNNAS